MSERTELIKIAWELAKEIEPEPAKQEKEFEKIYKKLAATVLIGGANNTKEEREKIGQQAVVEARLAYDQLIKDIAVDVKKQKEGEK